MTQVAREHIAYTIGMLEMAAEYFGSANMSGMVDKIASQCEVLRQVLDSDRRRCANEPRHDK